MDNKELILAGVDIPELEDRLMHNNALIKMIVGKFAQDKTYGQLQAAIAQRDLQAAEFACHSLKGMCGNMALKKLFALFQEQLRLFRAGEGDAAIGMMAQISQEYENALTHIRLWLAQ